MWGYTAVTTKTLTLADRLLRRAASSYGRRIDPGQWMARTISQSRKFVLDKEMSAFGADLAYAFLPKLSHGNRPRVNKLLESLRIQSRIPHALTWIEFDMRARTERATETYYARTHIDAKLDASMSPEQGGWMLLRHPKVDTAFMAIECVSHTRPVNSKFKPGMPSELDNEPLIDNPSMSPLAYAWTVDDCVPPWPLIGTLSDTAINASSLLTGIANYRVPQVGWTMAPWAVNSPIRSQITQNYINDMQIQLASDLRYLWALLTAINDVPVGYRTVTPTKGHMVGRNYKRFSEHTIVTLKVPHRMTVQKLAKKVAMAARRRAHQVREHHRRDWRNPLTVQCSHVFVAVPDTHLMECTKCHGRKMVIKEHQRGDASMGFVLHDYKVEHPKP